MSISENVSNCINAFLRQLNGAEEYDFVILMTRKLYSLYRSYIAISESREYVKKKPRIITNEAIPFFYDQLKGKRILIIDDIMIHGRTVDKVSTTLRECGATDINYKVFAISSDAQGLNSCGNKQTNNKLESIRNKVKYSMCFERAYWRRISREIVNRIRETLTPMRSASCFLTVNANSDIYTIQDIINGSFTSLHPFVENDPEYLDVKTVLADYQLQGNLECLAGIVDAVKLKIDYISDELSSPKATIDPQIFMKPLHEEDIESIWQKLNLAFEEREDYRADYRVAQYRFIKFYISKLISQAVLADLRKKWMLENVSISADDSDILFFVPSEMVDRVSDGQFAIQFLQVVDETSCKEYTLNENRANIMERLYCQERSFLENITDCGYADEILFKYPDEPRPARIEGARIKYLVDTLGVSYDLLIYTLSHSITTISHQLKCKWVTERILPGEQAYLEHLFKNPALLVNVQLDAAVARLASQEEYRKKLTEAFYRYEYDTVHERLQNILSATNIADRMQEPAWEEQKVNYEDFMEEYVLYMTDIDIYSLYAKHL